MARFLGLFFLFRGYVVFCFFVFGCQDLSPKWPIVSSGLLNPNQAHHNFTYQYCECVQKPQAATNLFEHSPVQTKIVLHCTSTVLFLLICVGLAGVVFEERLHTIGCTDELHGWVNTETLFITKYYYTNSKSQHTLLCRISAMPIIESATTEDGRSGLQ